jgi:hypothetical protein
MRGRAVFLGVLFVLMFSASAALSQTGSPTYTPGPSFFGAVAKPNFSPIMARPVFPTPLNIARFFPSMPNFRDLLLMRNPNPPAPTAILIPQAPPPPKK